MRAVHLKCPKCAATLDAPETARSVLCTYCGTSARIQHRTKFLERPAGMPAASPIEMRMPVVRVQHRKGWIFAVSFIVPVVAVGAGIFFSQRRVRAAMDQADSYQESQRESWSFSVKGNPILVDVNGDGEVDIIGHTRYVHDGDRHNLAAIDSTNGELLWESSSIGNHSDALSGVLAIHGDVLLQSDNIGTLFGYNKSDGASKWKISLGEKLDSLCAISPTNIALQLSDETSKNLNLSDGSIADIEATPNNCSAIRTTKNNSQPNLEYLHRRFDRHKGIPRHVKGMKIDKSVRIKDDGSIIVLGTKDPGTQVPMIGIFSPKPEVESKGARRKKDHSNYQMLWSSQLPTSDPLTVSEGVPEFVAANASLVCSLYERGHQNSTLVCFERKAGKRVWEHPLPGSSPMSGLDMTDRRVLVSRWLGLDALNTETGGIVFSLHN